MYIQYNIIDWCYVTTLFRELSLLTSSIMNLLAIACDKVNSFNKCCHNGDENQEARKLCKMQDGSIAHWSSSRSSSHVCCVSDWPPFPVVVLTQDRAPEIVGDLLDSPSCAGRAVAGWAPSHRLTSIISNRYSGMVVMAVMATTEDITTSHQPPC